LTVCLHFNLAQKETYKVADFRSPELKTKYVEAEGRNGKCKQAYFNYQAAKTLTERRQAAEILDSIRYSFFKQWTATNQSTGPKRVA